MIKNSIYLNLFYAYYSNKIKLRIIVRNIIGLVVLLVFEYKLIENYLDSMNILSSNFFRLALIIPSFLLTNIYWNSFRENDLYRLFGYIPVENKKVLIGMNLYIFIDITGKRLIYLLILPLYAWTNNKISLFECFSLFLLFLLLILTAQFICILFYEIREKYIVFILLTVLFLSVFFNQIISYILLVFIIICTFLMMKNIRFNSKKKREDGNGLVRSISNLKWEFKKFFSETPNIIGIIGMFIFLNIINYNLSSMTEVKIEFEIKYFLILFVLSSISPLNLLFSSDKELRSIAIYMPLKKKKIFITKFLIVSLISQTLLLIIVIINKLLLQENLGESYVKLFAILLMVNFIRLRFDMILPIINYENKSDLWRNPKKYVSLVIVIPILFVALNMSFYITILIGLAVCLLLEVYNMLFVKEDFYGHR
ncbi:hypothetical protein DOS71_09840 [Staphylococcus felis]|uniref:hypothetical protein n=1 Tax=Staphylococcus felis TaxID=46127 RepID=UPI000E21CB83|nr:hypothetical protein [Staphylococcus felis]REI08059.1 hypothetical protein DOS71_09840 [Staphylococcus felis]REI10009.1 hypothetical protein DOS69_00925 [Staphylococcus felis]